MRSKQHLPEAEKHNKSQEQDSSKLKVFLENANMPYSAVVAACVMMNHELYFNIRCKCSHCVLLVEKVARKLNSVCLNDLR